MVYLLYAPFPGRNPETVPLAHSAKVAERRCIAGLIFDFTNTRN